MKFTMNRDRMVVSRLGHSIDFKKGVPTHVPPALHREVMEAGAEPDEELKQDPRDPAAPTKTDEPTDPVEREKQILAAMEMIATENKRENFTAAGTPHNKAMAALLGWAPDAKERDTLWAQYQRGGKE